MNPIKMNDDFYEAIDLNNVFITGGRLRKTTVSS